MLKGSRLAQQQMTLSDLERPFHALLAISVVAELLVLFIIILFIILYVCTRVHIDF